MLRVGLTGGYATGKTFVAGELERLGCLLIYADELGHQVLLPSGEGYIPALQEFGPEILGEGQLIDRKKLAQRVFSKPDLLGRLSKIVHPAVHRLENALIANFATSHEHPIVVTEAAILIETGRYETFDRILLTVCSPETQIRRGMKRDGLSRQEVLDRMARQMPSDEKRAYAHYVVDTDASKIETVARVERIYASLEALARKT
jgi:dephospho-CoA kinase